jgi:quercetin dioxygenase-like cupin family protein
MIPIIETNKLERIQIRGADDQSVRWNGAFVVYGAHGTTQSSTIVYEIEPGGRLGWHTDATEESQYIIAGTGECNLKTARLIRSEPAAFLFCPPRCDTTWSPSELRLYGRSHSSQRQCSPKLSTM